MITTGSFCHDVLLISCASDCIKLFLVYWCGLPNNLAFILPQKYINGKNIKNQSFFAKTKTSANAPAIAIPLAADGTRHASITGTFAGADIILNSLPVTARYEYDLYYHNGDTTMDLPTPITPPAHWIWPISTSHR